VTYLPLKPSSKLRVRRKTRDELSHTVFLMLQECNKFREHQAREVLIDLLEKQLARRESLVKELDKCVDEADRLLLLPPRET
jgi:MED7 protein